MMTFKLVILSCRQQTDCTRYYILMSTESHSRSFECGRPQGQRRPSQIVESDIHTKLFLLGLLSLSSIKEESNLVVKMNLRFAVAEA